MLSRVARFFRRQSERDAKSRNESPADKQPEPSLEAMPNSAPAIDGSKSPISDALAQQLSSWTRGIAFELEFWERWFATKGAEWPTSYLERLDPAGENPQSLLDRLGIPQPKQKRVLDVGAGPMTFLKGMHAGEPVHVVACDPLAPYYSEMAERHGVQRPIATVQAFAEDLTAVFDLDAFDAVHCANALDHSFDPLRGIEEMLAVCKVGGTVLLSHSRNEAEFEHYTGFHQWNFDKIGDDFVIWNRHGMWNATARFSSLSIVTTECVGERHIFAAFKKNVPSNMNLKDRYRRRTRELLSALLRTSVDE